jgi:hypothetical protein
MPDQSVLEYQLDAERSARIRAEFLLQQSKAAHAMAERQLTEMREFVDDFCIQNGSRKSCCHCGKPVWWMHVRGSGPAVMYNPDLSEHWPRCAGMQRAAAAGGKSA